MAIFKGVVKVCEVCGESFKVPRCRAETAKACSTECSYKHRMQHRIRRVKLVCACCGKEFEDHECHADRRRFCSRECLHKDEAFKAEKSASRSGELNAAWRGGISVKTVSRNGKAYARSSPEKERIKSTAYVANNLEKVAANSARYRIEHKREMQAYGAFWRKAFPEKGSAKTAAYRARKLKATPSWADPVLILAFYEEAQRLTLKTGIVHHVDHMVPLQSKKVCGLHTQDNLCVLVGSDNISKSNRRWPDMP